MLSVTAWLACEGIFIFYSHVKIKVSLRYFILIAPLITLKLMWYVLCSAAHCVCS